jgi:outer membrane protein OmpA-like peptidoglycan-associated protein
MTSNTEKKPKIRRPRGLRIALYIVIFIGVVLSLLPELIRFTAVKWIENQGYQEIAIDDVDINLFSGVVSLSGVQFRATGNDRARLERLEVNVAMTALARRQLHVQQLRLIGLALDVTQDADGKITIAGLALPAAESPPEEQAQDEVEPWGIAIDDVLLRDLQVALDTPQLQTEAVVEQLSLGHTASWTPDVAAPLQLAMRIHDAPLIVEGEVKPFMVMPELTAHVDLQRLPLAMAATMAAEYNARELKGFLSLSSNVRLNQSGEIDANGTTVTLEELGLIHMEQAIQLAKLHIQGDIAYKKPSTDADLGARFGGDIGFEQLTVANTVNNLLLSSFERLSISGVQLAAEQKVNVGTIKLAQLHSVRDLKAELVGVDEFIVHNIEYDGRTNVVIQEVLVNHLVSQLDIAEEGGFPLLEALMAATAAGDAESAEQVVVVEDGIEKETPASQAWRFQVGKIQIAGDSLIRFADQSVEPAFNLIASPIELTATDIDTGAPDQPITLTLTTTLNELETVNLDTKVWPFGEKLNLEGQGKIRAVSLPALSPYALKASGYHLKRGQFNADFTTIIVEDQLDSTIKLKLKKFHIEEGEPAIAAETNKGMTIPLDAAFGILRDKDDNIELEIKIEGDVNDPNFDIKKVINKAIGNATAMATMTYLKFTFQPWGALWTVAELMGKGGKMKFDPVVFVAGQAQLSDEQRNYLSKIAKLLNERPGLNLNICGLVSEQDRQALQLPPANASQPEGGKAQVDAETKTEASHLSAPMIDNQTLINLAEARATAIKNVIIELGIDTDRLFPCHPTIEGTAEAQPAVELFL